MIILAILLATALAMLIARYNCSNKLFWVLFLSFMTGIAAGAVVFELNNGETKKDQTVVQKPQVPTVVTFDSLSVPTTPSAQKSIKTKTVAIDTTTTSDSCGSASLNRKLITSKSHKGPCSFHTSTLVDK